ncbi:MAG: protein phosphatase 2C domain-containing protein [Anaerolineae bacterium]|nr:protein phosphatase 2C domain-containing protein [Anaerolineae bacterium]
MPHVITLNQETDTPARREYIGNVALTYLYDRSRDSQQAGTRGQDFIAFCGNQKRLAFAVCDGVSQSFYGDLAARFLGEKLVAWLADLPFPTDVETFRAALSAQLAAWQPEADALVAAHPIRADLPPMLRDALVRKRENGSESMFLAALVDHQAEKFAACWMGDLRLRLFDANGEELPLSEAHWDMRQRWSSRLGAKNGAPQVLVMPLRGIARLMAHSDGFGSRADMLKRFTLDSLNALADELLSLPTSDDLSFLDIALNSTPDLLMPLETPEPQRVPDQPALHWQPVAGAMWYRVWLEGEGRAFTVDVTASDAPSFLLSAYGTYTCRVQALSNYHLPSALSASFRLERAPFPEPTIMHHAEPVPAKPITVKQPTVQSVAVPTVSLPEPVPTPQPKSAEPFDWSLVTAIAAGISVGLAVVWYFTYMQ